MALPLGVEPRSSVPETNVLSIELQEQGNPYKILKAVFGQIDYPYTFSTSILKLDHLLKKEKTF